MQWVKLFTRYYADKAVALGSDASEVMFVRGLGLAGELEESGFIPDAMLHHLARKPAIARRTAAGLVKVNLWERTPGGYLIVNWDEYQADLEKYVERKNRDKERKRRKRAEGQMSGEMSADTAADASAPEQVDTSTPAAVDSLSREELEVELDAATAAAVTPLALDPMLAGLQAVMHRYTKLRHIRFDATPAEKVAEIRDLIAIHGDERLVEIALKAPEDVAHVGWFLGSWRALPTPGVRLAAVEQRFCPTHDWIRLTPSGACTACASEALAGGAS